MIRVSADFANSLGGGRIARGLLGGGAMVAPFYAEFFSWRWVVLISVPFFLFFLVYREKIKKPPLAVLPMMVLLLGHLLALFFSSTPFADQVIKDLVVASFLLFIFFLSDEDLSSGFFALLMPLAITTAALGLLKAALLDRGYLIGFIADGCTYYPAGSALCVNYNNLGFMWFVAVLGCIKWRLWWAVPLLVTAGVLSSSRRFIVLAMLLPFIWIALQGWADKYRVLCTAVLSFLLISGVSDPDSFERFRFGGEDYKVLRLDGVFAVDNLYINRSNPEVMLSTMADGTLGTASRLELWRLGASMLKWWPQGWSYHQIFSCEFSSCSSFEYPHMTIISEWIIGGALFAVVTIGFFLWPLFRIAQARQLSSGVLFVVALPYVLISGDTVFSLPACVSCMLVALSSVRGLPQDCCDKSLSLNK